MKYELVNFCEFDRFAENAYCAIHNVDKSINLGDITKVDEKQIADFNMMVFGFPCQPFSQAGEQKGFDDERGNLFFEAYRILKEKLPKIFIFENVQGLLSHDKGRTIEIILTHLGKLPYEITMDLLNSKDFGVPQNRNRIFCIGRLIENSDTKKDLNKNKIRYIRNKKCEDILKKMESEEKIKVWWDFKFPKPFDNGIRLKDFLESEVDEKFYLSQDKVDKLLSQIKNKDTLMFDQSQYKREEYLREYNDFSPTLNSRDYKDPRLVNASVNVVGKINSSQDGVVVSTDGIAPTHTAGHGNCPKILQTPRGFNKGGLHDIAPTISSHSYECNNFVTENNKIETLCSVASRGRYVDNTSETEQQIEINNTGFSNAITTVQKDSMVLENSKVLCPQRKYDEDGNRSVEFSVSDITPTILATQHKSGDNQCKIYENFRIRKLSPLECFRLQGFTDEDFNKAKESMNNTFYKGKDRSSSQLYKMAGNSITVDVLYYIYLELYKALPELFDDIKLSSFFSGIGAFEVSLSRLIKHINSNNDKLIENFTKAQVD